MTADYDAIVIGAGPSGEVCAGALADGGLRVAIVERELVAGECSFWACIPSKTLLRAGEALEAARDVPGAREAVTGDLDAAAALAYRDFMVSDYDDAGQAAWLDEKGIALHRGSGELAGPGEVTVDGRLLRAEHVVLATGSDPIVPPIPGLDEIDDLWTNREATGLKEVPERLLVLGGGPVGVEMAQAIHRLGADVALVEGAEHVLPREPRALGEGLGAALRADGVDLHLGVHAERVAAAAGGGVEATLEDGTTLRADRLMLATGRSPRTAGLGLERAGIELERGAVPVDGRMAAGEGMWAIGDVTGIWPLTYVGKYQARIAAANILGSPREANYDAVPRVVFTDPQAASVGAADGALESTVALSGVARTSTYTRAYAEEPWFARLVSDGERLTGACALGPEAGEWLQQATLAIRAQTPLEVLRDVIQPFPTFSEVFVDALAGLGAPVAVAA